MITNYIINALILPTSLLHYRKDALMKILFKATRMLFYELVNTILLD
jgi:hypothetical protein